MRLPNLGPVDDVLAWYGYPRTQCAKHVGALLTERLVNGLIYEAMGKTPGVKFAVAEERLEDCARRLQEYLRSNDA